MAYRKRNRHQEKKNSIRPRRHLQHSTPVPNVNGSVTFFSFVCPVAFVSWTDCRPSRAQSHRRFLRPHFRVSISSDADLTIKKGVVLEANRCGGFIISERWVLIVTHSFSFMLRMGISNVTDDGHLARVELAHCHEKNDGNKYHNDICLIKTAEQIPFSDRIRPIKLATREQDEEIKSVNASGWDKTLNNTEEPYTRFRLK